MAGMSHGRSDNNGRGCIVRFYFIRNTSGNCKIYYHTSSCCVSVLGSAEANLMKQTWYLFAVRMLFTVPSALDSGIPRCSDNIFTRIA
jgi:hypothetical protein